MEAVYTTVSKGKGCVKNNMNKKIYEDKIHDVGFSVFTGGEETEGYNTEEELRKIFSLNSIIGAFLDDDDIQQIKIVSTNLGFGRTYTKRFRKDGVIT